MDTRLTNLSKGVMPMRMKEIREQAGLSQEAVARAIGVAHKTYVRWEHGGVPKQWEQLIQLASLLNCRPEELVNDQRAEATDPNPPANS